MGPGLPEVPCQEEVPFGWEESFPEEFFSEESSAEEFFSEESSSEQWSFSEEDSAVSRASSCTRIVAIVSPSWLKTAAKRVSSSVEQTLDILQAMAVTKVTSSQGDILQHLFFIKSYPDGFT